MTTMAELILKADYRQITGAKGALDDLSATGSKAAGVLRGLAATLGIAFGVREVLQAADAYKTLTNRLALVTDGTEQLAAAQSDVFRIAQQTRAPLGATAEVYQRIATNADQLGLTLGEVGQTTERINKLMAISGTSGQAAEAALTQLGQAFASGTLRGEELNSVMEQAPALAKSIADGMGVTVGQLRAMGQEGKITATAVVEALQKQGTAIDEQFGKMAPTLSQSVTQIGNSFTQLVGKVDAASGATGALATALSEISGFIDGPALETASRLFGTWGASFGNAADNAKNLSGSLDDVGTGAKAIIWYVSNAFIEMPANVKAIVGITTTYIAAFIDDTDNRFTRAKDRWNAIWNDSTWADAQKAYDTRAKAIQSAKESSIDAILRERDAEIEAGNAKAAAAAKNGDTSSLNKGGGAPKAIPKDDKKKKQHEIDLQDLNLNLADKMQAEIDAEMKRRAWLEETFASELEAENIRYQNRLEMLQEYLTNAGLTEDEARAKREAVEQEHHDKLTQIRADAAANDKSSMANRLGATKKFLDDVYSATGKNSERTAKLIRTVGAAQAVANAYIAASQALADPSVPFFAKFAAVAQVIATGMGLVNAIKSGGSSGAPSGGGRVSPDTSGIAAAAPPPVRAQTVDFRIESRGIWRDDDVADLMKAIGERVSDGAKFGRVEFVRS